jgi:hypothetical protein
VKIRIIISGDLMALWLAMLVPLSGVVAEALGNGNELSDAALIRRFSS